MPSFASDSAHASDPAGHLFFPGFEPDAFAPSPPPTPRSRRAQPRPSDGSSPTDDTIAAPVQIELFREPVRLPLLGAPPFPACLRDAKTCAHYLCREHLGGERFYRGRLWRCAVDVAGAFPHGLPPVDVARLLGLDEGEVQSIEKTVARRPGFEALRDDALRP